MKRIILITGNCVLALGLFIGGAFALMSSSRMDGDLNNMTELARAYTQSAKVIYYQSVFFMAFQGIALFLFNFVYYYMKKDKEASVGSLVTAGRTHPINDHNLYEPPTSH